MTDPTNDDTELVDEDLDTTDGTRDPLSTDDGLAAVAAEGMPEVPERDTPPGEDYANDDERPLLDNPGLDVDDNGDPCAQLGACDDGEG